MGAVLIALWMIAGVASNDCASEATDLNQSACEAGTGIGVAIIGLFGFFGFLLFALTSYRHRLTHHVMRLRMFQR